MGRAQVRLNPRVTGPVDRGLLEVASAYVFNKLSAMPVPTGVRRERRTKRGRPSWDWRIVATLLIINALLRKTWLDYEAELRRSQRLREVFGTATLPSRGTLYRAFRQWPLLVWREIMTALLCGVIHDGMNLAVDSTGVTLRHASTWFVARIGQYVKKKDHMKLHAIWALDLGLIIDCRLTSSSRSDGPMFRLMLAPLRQLGMVFGDKAYCCKKTIEMILDRGGSPFLAFKKNARRTGFGTWATQVRFSTGPLQWAWKNICHQRSKIESVFSAIKRRYGSTLRSRTLSSRRRELFLRVLAYNVRQLLYLRYAREHNLPLWVRAQ